MLSLENMINHVSRVSNNERLLLGSYILSAVLLFLYSFTQIDLGLVISRFPVLYSIEKTFQYVGYFNRPLSTALFIFLVSIFSLLYLYSLRYISSISHRTVWIIIISLSVILFLSYNAFSYDLFNYIFDAKIVTHYHANPYLHKALDYPADPMLSFMHWTHRVYPYGPIWLALTVPLSYIGLGLFLPTFYLFKLLMIVSYVGTAYVIGKILRLISPSTETIGVASFALNPLVIFETLISGHNDIVMMFVMVLSLYLLLKKKTVWSGIVYLLSIGTKFATIFLLPVYLLLLTKRGQVTEKFWEKIMTVGIGLMFVAVLLASYRSNFQPWYLLFVIPFTSLISSKRNLIYPVLLLSITALCNYIPYLYMGTWTDIVVHNLMLLDGGVSALGVLWYIILLSKKV
jgi:hypothetical protein